MEAAGTSKITLSSILGSYSDTKMAEIATRVIEDLDFDKLTMNEEFCLEYEGKLELQKSTESYANDEEHEAVQFSFATRRSQLSSPISPDEIFHNGQIRPVYPVLKRESLLNIKLHNNKQNVVRNSDSKKIRLPLQKLFDEEREAAMMTTSSSSSSEVDDVDGVPSELYCVWRPNTAEGRWRKSNSAGSDSKRWNLRELFQRSHSDGDMESFVFTGPNKTREKEQKVKETQLKTSNRKPPAHPSLPPQPYNRDGGQKRLSYLPYRRGIVSFFGNVGLTRNIKPS